MKLLPDGQIKCDAEDQGGWDECYKPAAWQTTDARDQKQQDQKRYYCADHRINRHIWSEEEARQVLEPVSTPDELEGD